MTPGEGLTCECSSFRAQTSRGRSEAAPVFRDRSVAGILWRFDPRRKPLSAPNFLRAGRLSRFGRRSAGCTSIKTAYWSAPIPWEWGAGARGHLEGTFESSGRFATRHGPCLISPFGSASCRALRCPAVTLTTASVHGGCRSVAGLRFTGDRPGRSGLGRRPAASSCPTWT